MMWSLGIQKSPEDQVAWGVKREIRVMLQRPQLCIERHSTDVHPISEKLVQRLQQTSYRTEHLPSKNAFVVAVALYGYDFAVRPCVVNTIRCPAQ